MYITIIINAFFQYLCYTKKQYTMANNETEDHSPQESLENFIIEEKFKAFNRRYKPFADDGTLGCAPDRIFNEQALRRFFGAYPKTVGDPLSIYVDGYLASAGFHMEVDEFVNEPVIKVSLR